MILTDKEIDEIKRNALKLYPYNSGAINEKLRETHISISMMYANKQKAVTLGFQKYLEDNTYKQTSEGAKTFKDKKYRSFEDLYSDYINTLNHE